MCKRNSPDLKKMKRKKNEKKSEKPHRKIKPARDV